MGVIDIQVITMKQVQWKKLVLQATLWLATEILLTSIGFDDMADYGEYQLSYREFSGSAVISLNAL